MLTEEQIGQYQRDGYLVVDGLFSPSEVAELRLAADDPVVKRGLQDSGFDEHIVHLLEITCKHAAFRELARDPRITVLVAQLIGPDVQLQHSKLATKPPKKDAGAFAWHQDFAFFPHTNTDLLAVMVMLDDATPQNGCMSVVKGSHKAGQLSHQDDEGWFLDRCLEPQYWEAHPENIVQLTPRAGGISIHHGLTLHSSPNNVSGLPRRGVVFQYRAADAYQLSGNVWADTGFQVSGVYHEQARCSAGTLRLSRSARRTANHFGNMYFQSGKLAREWNETAGAETLNTKH
jgi:ectoine hydroxylase-related dioxygenase (phytanoyl-CoA dioxygenase family)